MYFLVVMTKPAAIPKKELKQSILVIALLVGVLVVSTLLLVTPYWFVWPAIVVCLLVGIGYFSASKHPYQCPSCNRQFRITALQDFFAFHGISKGSNGEVYEWKRLKCPQCRRREKCYRVELSEKA
jgi:fatty-acid desaturase